MSSLDSEKIKLESKHVGRVKSVLKKINKELEVLIKSEKPYNITEVLNQYKPDLVFILRLIYRDTIPKFGFELRDDLSNKKFHTFDTRIEKALLFSERKEDLESVDLEFNELAILFLLESSLRQADIILETSEREILKQSVKAGDDYISELVSLNNRLDTLEQELYLGKVTQEEVDKLREDVEHHISNRDLFIESMIIDALNRNLVNRANLITEYNVGLAESWSRDTEARLLVGAIAAGLIAGGERKPELVEQWDAILDSRTRPAHVRANGQIKSENGMFLVGGEFLKYPRDPAGSPGNILRCRCNTKRYFK